MFFVTTGANGTGKTLFTLKDVRDLQLRTGRPVAYNGRFKMVSEFGWKLIDIKNWQDEPDGTIFLVDECQYDFPLRGAGAPPEWIQRLSEHRARGFDFFLITQHVNNIDVFIRRLVGTPGWHRHMKPLGAGLVVQVTWNFANGSCEKPGQGDLGERTTRAHPKEVYTWYESATLHTAKAKLPRAVYIMVACLVALPLLAYYGITRMKSMGTKAVALGGPAGAASAPGVPARAVGGRPGAPGQPPLSPVAYLEARVPRLPGLPQTAPAFDKLTEPSIAPYPAACVQSAKSCKCWTQQGTLLPATPAELCRQIVAQGFFMEWAAAGSSGVTLGGGVGVPAVAKGSPVQVASLEPVGAGPAPGGVRAPARAGSGAGGASGGPGGGESGARVLIGPAAASQPPQYFGPAAGAAPYLGDVVEDLPDGQVIGHIRRGQRSW
jgi:zona occludens toxin